VIGKLIVAIKHANKTGTKNDCANLRPATSTTKLAAVTRILAAETPCSELGRGDIKILG